MLVATSEAHPHRPRRLSEVAMVVLECAALGYRIRPCKAIVAGEESVACSRKASHCISGHEDELKPCRDVSAGRLFSRQCSADFVQGAVGVGMCRVARISGVLGYAYIALWGDDNLSLVVTHRSPVLDKFWSFSGVCAFVVVSRRQSESTTSMQTEIHREDGETISAALAGVISWLHKQRYTKGGARHCKRPYALHSALSVRQRD
ncbi:hypothetical protein DFP72DRAFT_840581 [Ephemerocybe angulata]|uniref:Uncharacterized protein n=1 Tax=Ephemerocybe angulata TaxID=980116 RepID=A0A8H6MFS1_9AGAR|nr:hypothetical protein DFP72DRAFT_840577 [Tulosesus angulatus]KAF6764544.1 hypothetical protein DFP72DRAFT_840581 [Tulosesus angulatus]